MKSGTQTVDGFLNQTPPFCQADPNVGQKLSSFVAVLAQSTYMYGCRLMVHHSKVNISLWVCNVHEILDGINRYISISTAQFADKPIPIWRNFSSFGAVLAKAHVYMALDDRSTTPKSILVHNKDQ